MDIKYIFFFLIINFSNAYVLRKDINGFDCKINKPFIISYNDNICNYNFNYYNPFKFNDCLLLKKNIIRGLDYWIKNNDKIVIFNSSYSFNNNNFIKLFINFDFFNDNKIGSATRNCNNQFLIKSFINLNKDKCLMPNFYLCNLNSYLFILLFLLLIFTHLLLIMFTNNLFIKILLIPSIIFELTISIFILINCNKCTPITRVLAHEFGHILGFGHPDEHKYFNWIGNIQNCKLNKVFDTNYDSQSIMLSNSESIKFNNAISFNDWLGLYDLFPSCNNKYFVNDYDGFNENNFFFAIFFLLLTIIPSILSIIIYFFYKFYKKNLSDLPISNNYIVPSPDSITDISLDSIDSSDSYNLQ